MIGSLTVQALLEQVPRPLQLGAPVPCQELREVGVPDVKDIGPLEHGDPLLVGLEGLLEVVVLLEEEPVVDDDLGRGDAEVQHPVIHRLRRLERPEALLEVGVQGPHLEALVEPHLHGLALVVVGDLAGGRRRGALQQLETLLPVVVPCDRSVNTMLACDWSVNIMWASCWSPYLSSISTHSHHTEARSSTFK